eukprot:359362-Chlamydomonas_euryale.AAC.10
MMPRGPWAGVDLGHAVVVALGEVELSTRTAGLWRTCRMRPTQQWRQAAMIGKFLSALNRPPPDGRWGRGGGCLQEGQQLVELAGQAKVPPWCGLRIVSGKNTSRGSPVEPCAVGGLSFASVRRRPTSVSHALRNAPAPAGRQVSSGRPVHPCAQHL